MQLGVKNSIYEDELVNVYQGAEELFSDFFDLGQSDRCFIRALGAGSEFLYSKSLEFRKSIVDLLFREDGEREMKLVHWAHAQNGALSRYDMELYAKSDDPYLRGAVVHNKNLPQDLWDEILKEELEDEVIVEIARTRRVTGRELESLFIDFGKDEEEFMNDVCSAIAANDRTPFSVVTELMKGNERENEDIFIPLARHPKLTIPMMDELSNFNSISVLGSLALHDDLPLQIRQFLATFYHRDVAVPALLHSSTPLEWHHEHMNHFNLDSMQETAICVSLPHAPLSGIYSVKRSKVIVVQYLARNPKTPVRILEDIARRVTSSDLDIRCALASNPNTPRWFLKHLIEGGHELELKKMIGNPVLTLDDYILIGEKVSWDLKEDIIRLIQAALQPPSPEFSDAQMAMIG